MRLPDPQTALAMLAATSEANERSLSGGPPSELYAGMLRAFVELTGSRHGFLAEAIVSPKGALVLVVRAGDEPGNLLALLGPALGSGHADVTPSSLTLPLMADGGLVGVVGLGGRAEGYDDAIVEGLRPLTVAAASLVVRLHLDV